jgi:hypothetical protein
MQTIIMILVAFVREFALSRATLFEENIRRLVGQRWTLMVC